MIRMTERADNLPIAEKDLKLLIRGLEKRRDFRALLFSILGTGMSLEDALGVRIRDIDYARSEIRVYDIWTGRTRSVRLNLSVVQAIREYQDGKTRLDERLFEIESRTAISWLYDHSQERLGRPLSWMAIRRTWAVLGFKNGIPFKDMVESSGTTAQQLAVWSLWDKGNGNGKEPPDLLAGLLK